MLHLTIIDQEAKTQACHDGLSSCHCDRGVDDGSNVAAIDVALQCTFSSI